MPYITRMTPERSYKLTVMMSPNEEQMLRHLAESEGLSSSDYVRQVLREQLESRTAGVSPAAVPAQKALQNFELEHRMFLARLERTKAAGLRSAPVEALRARLQELQEHASTRDRKHEVAHAVRAYESSGRSSWQPRRVPRRSSPIPSRSWSLFYCQVDKLKAKGETSS